MLRYSFLFLLIVSMMTETNITVLGQVSSTESSAEYLYNVMNQLQEHNRPSPVSVDRTTGSGDDFSYFINKGQSSFNIGQEQNEILQTEKPAFHDYHRYLDNNRMPKVSTDHSITLHNDQQFSESVTPYYQVQAPQTIVKAIQMIKEPAPLGLTRNDLALLYKKALQQGSPVSLSTLKTSLTPSQVPQINGNHIKLNSGHPGYYYYFYPLKTFVNELQDNHDHKIIPYSIKPEHSDLAAESSEKQMSNPLFMAISGFIGMALIFMASVLFLPRFESFGSRNSSDEFFQLTKVAWEAIEGRNCTERFACELNKVAGKLELSKRSRRLLENVVPTNLRRQMIRMRKSTRKRQECKLIMCKCT